MGHFSEYKSDAVAPDGRALGDEWADWDGSGEYAVKAGRGLFIASAAAVVVIVNFLLCLLIYLITPRLAGWNEWLPGLAWLHAGTFIVVSVLWSALLVATVVSGRNFFPGRRTPYLLFDMVFSRSFKIAGLFGVSRDRMGHSFVRVSNTLSRAMKGQGEEKLLILLPRCLSKEELKAINDLREKYPFDVHTVSGGELARKKVKELKPTAVIGVACERDLVSGIRDVGRRISVIGIPNQRPEGPCRNTHIDMAELVDAIEFYVGPPKNS